MNNVAIIGGGISGLASAFYLVEGGAQVTLYEGSDQFGGLGTFFSHDGKYFERFYHCMLPGDNDLLELLAALNIQEKVYWQPTKFAFMSNGTLYSLNTPLDVLCFRPLPVVDRLRIGFTGLYGTLVCDNGLDDISAASWLTRLSGKRAFDIFWKPMLQAKFGDQYQNIPALWFWTRFNREKGGKKEYKGYIRGGYKFLTDTLVTALHKKGAKLNLNSPVEFLELDGQGAPVLRVCGERKVFDQVLVTTPLFYLRQLAGNGSLNAFLKGIDLNIDSQGVVNVVLLTNRPLSNYYWMATVDKHVPFQGVVETTSIMEAGDKQGYNLVYLMNYVHRTNPLFEQSAEDIASEYTAALFKLFPSLAADNILHRYVFKAPFVEPIYTTGYLKRQPPLELVKGRVFLATTAQVYPDVTSWNGSTGLAKKVCGMMIRCPR